MKKLADVWPLVVLLLVIAAQITLTLSLPPSNPSIPTPEITTMSVTSSVDCDGNVERVMVVNGVVVSVEHETVDAPGCGQ